MGNDLDSIGKIIETGVDPRRVTGKFHSVLGPNVILIRKPKNQWADPVSEELPAYIAMNLLFDDPENGDKYASGMIDWCGAPSWQWDQSA